MGGPCVQVGMTIEWRDVVGFEGLYTVSSDGQVYSRGRIQADRNGRVVPYRARMLKAKPNVITGRRIVTLAKDGVHLREYVYVLVAAAFIGPRPKGMQVGHRNDVCNDDRAENLHYVTNQENSFEKTENGRNTNANKTHCKRGHEYVEGSFRVKIQGKTVGRECIRCEKIRNDEKYAIIKAARETARQSGD